MSTINGICGLKSHANESRANEQKTSLFARNRHLLDNQYEKSMTIFLHALKVYSLLHIYQKKLLDFLTARSLFAPNAFSSNPHSSLCSSCKSDPNAAASADRALRHATK